MDVLNSDSQPQKQEFGDSVAFSDGGYSGRLHRNFASASNFEQLRSLLLSGDVLVDRRNTISRIRAVLGGSDLDLACKGFGRESRFRNLQDRYRGSKAERSFKAALHLQENGVGTPEPIGFIERWEGLVLVESYYLCGYTDPSSDFREELFRLYDAGAPCEAFMSLLQTIAVAVRRMHDAGFVHLDLGNQNIFVRELSPSFWDDVQFIDLNRGKIRPGITTKEQARDISRLSMPSEFKRVFIEMMYAPDEVPAGLKDFEKKFVARYRRHTISRKWRHPLRTLKRKRSGVMPGRRYPDPKDMFLWDPRSGQPISVMTRKDRKRFASRKNYAEIAWAAACEFFPARKRYKLLLEGAYREPVVMKDRIAISISGCVGALEGEVKLLEELGPIPVHLRFYHHEAEADWRSSVEIVTRLREQGHEVSIALVQDRRAVTNGASWAEFCAFVISQLHDQVAFVEVGHAINRVKWGIWTMAEYRGLLQPIAALKERYPGLVITGPGVIDFEFHYLAAALRKGRQDAPIFDRQSIHLYVDRRGAPESPQGAYATLEKLALARAIGQGGGLREDRLVISEVNWPVANTGVYSPVVSPYDSPGPRNNDPSVSEEVYAWYMVRYYLIALCSGFAERVCWWQLVARGYGLIDDKDAEAWRKRPAFNLLKGLISEVGGAVFVRKHAFGAKAHGFEFEQDGLRKIIAYTESDEEGVTLPVKVDEIRRLDGTVLELDSLSIGLTGEPLVFVANV